LDEIKWENQNFESWSAKLQKELKTSSLSDKELHIDFDVIYNPYKDFGGTYLKHEIKDFPSLCYAQEVNVHNESEANSIILELLKNDLRVLKLNLVQTPNWALLLDNIYLDLISVVLVCSKDIYKSFIEFSQSQKTEKWQVYYASPNASFTHHFISYANLELSHSELFHCIKNDLQLINSHQINIEINFSENLLEIIPFARALRIYFEKTYPNKTLILSAQSSITNLSKDNNEELTRAGSQAMFCSMAGINHLYVKPISKKEDINQHRLLLNIQNLMELESKVTEVKDSLSGSFIIEDLTKQFLDVIN